MVKIIADYDILQNFIDSLPDLLVGECYYVSLFVRKKYWKEAPLTASDKRQLRRLTTSKEGLLHKLEQLETTYRIKGVEIPQEAVVPYISINPRSLVEASKKSAIKLVDLLTKPYNGYNPHEEVLSEIHKACSRKIYVDFDFDLPYSEDIWLPNREAVRILITKNGFHVLVEPKKIADEFKKTWYKTLAECSDVKGDNLIPIPGCYQAGFMPYFL